MSAGGAASALPATARSRRETGLRNFTASSLVALAVFFLAACRHLGPPASKQTPAASDATSAPLSPSPRLIVGRVLSVEAANGFAIVDLLAEAPQAALAEGTELMARTLDLRETARLRASRHVRGRTLGARIVSGQPAPGDEVVWLAP